MTVIYNMCCALTQSISINLIPLILTPKLKYLHNMHDNLKIRCDNFICNQAFI